MKRFQLIATALLLAVTAVPALAQDAATEKAIVANERAINDAFAKGDKAGFEKFVAADGWAIDPVMGRMSLAEFLKGWAAMTKDMKVTSWDLTDTKVMWIDANTALLNYKWTGKGTYQGQPMPSPTLASTLWVKKNGKWMAMFHQETAMVAAAAAKK